MYYCYNDAPPLKVTADIFEVKYSGNYYTPIYKRFKIEYKCKVSTRDTGVGKAITGNIDGDIDMTIKGFCTMKKAKGIAAAEVLKAVQNSLSIK